MTSMNEVHDLPQAFCLSLGDSIQAQNPGPQTKVRARIEAPIVPH